MYCNLHVQDHWGIQYEGIVSETHLSCSCDTVSQMYMYGTGKGKAPEDDRQLELENLNNSYIPIDQVIEEASKCVLDCHRTRETKMSAARYDICVMQQ